MKTLTRTVLVGATAFLFIGICVWWIQERPFERAGPHSRVLEDLGEVSSAIRNYQAEYNKEPPTDPKEFFAALAGANDTGLRFLSDGRASFVSGRRCDRWGTPYQVYYSFDGWLVRSAGPNRAFDDLRIGGVDDVTLHVPPASTTQAEQSGGGNSAALRASP